MVATPRAMIAARLPIHCQLSFKSHNPTYEAKLNANRGRKTRKPTEADRPMPKKMLIMVSEVIHEFTLFPANKKIALKSDQVQLFFGAGDRGVEPAQVFFVHTVGQIGLLHENGIPLAAL